MTYPFNISVKSTYSQLISKKVLDKTKIKDSTPSQHSNTFLSPLISVYVAVIPGAKTVLNLQEILKSVVTEAASSRHPLCLIARVNSITVFTTAVSPKGTIPAKLCSVTCLSPQGYVSATLCILKQSPEDCVTQSRAGWLLMAGSLHLSTTPVSVLALYQAQNLRQVL